METTLRTAKELKLTGEAKRLYELMLDGYPVRHLDYGSGPSREVYVQAMKDGQVLTSFSDRTLSSLRRRGAIHKSGSDNYHDFYSVAPEGCACRACAAERQAVTEKNDKRLIADAKFRVRFAIAAHLIADIAPPPPSVLPSFVPKMSPSDTNK